MSTAWRSAAPNSAAASAPASSPGRSGVTVTSTSVRPEARSCTESQATSRPAGSCTRAWRRVHEPVPTSWPSTASGSTPAEPFAARWWAARSAATSGASAAAGTLAVSPAREPVDRHVGIGHADHSPTHGTPGLHACAREDGDGQERRHRRPPSQETLTRNWDEPLQEIRATGSACRSSPVSFSRRRSRPASTSQTSSAACTSRCSRVGAHHRPRGRPGRDAPGALPAAPARAARRGGQPVRDGRLALLALTISGVVLLVVDVVVGGAAGWLAGGAILLVLTVLWARASPGRHRARRQPAHTRPPPADSADAVQPRRRVSGGRGGAGARPRRSGRRPRGRGRRARRRAARACHHRPARGGGTGAPRRRGRRGTPRRPGSARPR